MAIEWFRKTTWSTDDQADFGARLKRSRVGNRSQYLRIQAYHLQHDARPQLFQEALDLLELWFAEYRDPIAVAAALNQKAECIHALRGFDSAVSVYREALEYEKADPSLRTALWVEFPWHIVQERKVSLYSEAEQWLQFPQSESVMFPIDLFRMAIVRATIAEHRGDIAAAKQHARDAHSAAALSASPFPRHKSLGLVKSVDDWAKRDIARILAL